MSELIRAWAVPTVLNDPNPHITTNERFALFDARQEGFGYSTGYFVPDELLGQVRELIDRGEKLCAAQLEVAKMFHPDEQEYTVEAKAILEKHRAALAILDGRVGE